MRMMIARRIAKIDRMLKILRMEIVIDRRLKNCNYNKDSLRKSKRNFNNNSSR
jgi:hypothetical protein